jgi:hypothetical protein
MEDKKYCPHTKGLDSELDFGTNPCGEIALGEPQQCILPMPVDPPQTEGLRRERLTVVSGHMHVRSNSEPGIVFYTGQLSNYKVRYNESRS